MLQDYTTKTILNVPTVRAHIDALVKKYEGEYGVTVSAFVERCEYDPNIDGYWIAVLFNYCPITPDFSIKEICKLLKYDKSGIS